MRTVTVSRYALSISVAAIFLAACSVLRQAQDDTQPSRVLPPTQTVAATRNSSGKLQHVVIIVQMDRSFNNLFYGYSGARTVSYGYDTKNQKVELKPISLATKWTIVPNAYAACNGTGRLPGAHCRMNGFNKEHWTCDKPGHPRCPIKYPPYAYVPHLETKPYFDIAHQYVLADAMYASNFDASSFGSLQYIIEAQDHGALGYPSGMPGCGGGPHDWLKTLDGKRIHPCFDNPTLGDELDAANLSWAYYESGDTDGICGKGGGGDDRGAGYGMWIAYWAIKHICYGPDWNKDVISPPDHFLSDVKNGELRTVSWITPTYQSSDEAGSDSGSGPSWVASLVNAVGESKYWNSTAIFILWDSFGGWYDPEPPQYLGRGSLGFRVPLLIVSPYAREDYVSHVHYEHGSILRFAEDQFGLARLSSSDTRANSPSPDCFNFNQAPRRFIQIKT